MIATLHGHSLTQQPSPNDFADMLENLFCGAVAPPEPQILMSEPPFTMQELKHALGQLKTNKSGDEAGLVAELVQVAPVELLEIAFLFYNHVLTSGDVPAEWRKTLFTMIAKTMRAKTVTDFRPIAPTRIFLQQIAYMLLARMDPILDNQQPEEQHRFRAHYRLEEHLITANIVIDKLLGTNKPIWIVSLDLSKAFDRINWDALWLSLRDRLGSAMPTFEPGGTGCRQFGLQSWFCYQCWDSWRVRAESEAFHVCGSMGDGDLATTGYSFWFWYRFAWWYA